ncbi:MAG: hypothetical protein K2O78_08420 [Muribaculaceae bacterium]|nr:hypothetical protein [Muribaculaceae bacterium]
MEITPNKVAQDALDKAVEGKVMRTEILPLADKLKDAVVNTLRDLQVPLNGVTVPSDKLIAAVTQALASANFTAIGEGVGDQLSKGIALKVSGQPYNININAKTADIVNAINKAIETLEKKERKIKLDKSAIKEFRDELEKSLKDKVTITPTLSLTQEALQRAVEGKVMKLEVMPLMTNLRRALLDATTQSPARIEVDVDAVKLRNLVTSVLTRQGFMLNIETVTGLEKSIQTLLKNKVYDVTLRCDPAAIVRSMQTALTQIKSKTFGLQISRNLLRKSIDDALGAKPFSIQLQVRNDQARQAVQTALNGASNISLKDAKTHERMMMAEQRASQASLNRTREAHIRAADAARTHASASISLGGALGSNIRIAGELGSAMASLYSVHALKEFLAQVIEIGGELEHQKIAMDTIFGDKGKTIELFGEIKGLARQSPFGVMELTKSVKALSAYGVQYNEIYDTAKRLADISAATSVDINRLILAFGKTKSRGFLDGLEAKQFAYANIPIYEMVRKKLEEVEGQAISTADVMKRIKKREIGFDMVKEVLWDITDKGGKFYNMQEALAGSVKTSWKLVRDNIDLMFGEIAESKIGDWLKGLAVILQGLTRNWQILGAGIGAAVAVLGISKVATMGLNRCMAESTAGIVQNMMAEKQREAARLRAVSTVTSLSAAEKELVATANRLTAANLSQLMSDKGLMTHELKMLYIKGLLTRATINQAVAEGTLTRAQATAIMGANRFQGAMIRLKAASIGAGQALKSAFASLGAFLLNPVTLAMAAIGAVMILWQKNADEMRKAEEIGNGIATKAVEGLDNIKKAAEGFGNRTPTSDTSNHTLKQDIEEMQQLIKDYSPTPIEDINNSLVDQQGHILTLTEQWDVLNKRVQTLRDAYSLAAEKNFGDLIEKSLKATDGEYWITAIFNDNLETNAKDYSNALKKTTDRIAKWSKKIGPLLHVGVNAAVEADEKFKTATAGMSAYEEKLKYLAENVDKYKQAQIAFDKVMTTRRDVPILAAYSNEREINSTKKELLNDIDALVKDVNERLAMIGITPGKMTDVQKTALAISFKSMLSQMEQAGDDAKALIAQTLEEQYNMAGMIMEDKIGPSIQAKFVDFAQKSTDEAVHAAVRKLKYEGYANLSTAEKELVDKLMGQAKSETMAELGVLNKDMQNYLTANPLSQIITLIYQQKNAPTELAKELVDKHGQEGLTDDIDSKINSWTREGKVDSARKKAQEAYQAAYDELIAAKKAGVGIEVAQKEFDKVKAALKYLNWTDLKLKGDKKSGSSKDPIAEALKQRFKDIKDAWSEFQKWAKTEGKEAAFKRIGDSGIFSTLSADEIPQTVEQYRALVVKIEDELRKAGIAGHSQRESLLNELLKQLLEIDKTVIDEQLKLALDKVSKEAERQLADWNLFDKIRKATGNQDLAMSIAFGMNATAETDYPAMIKQQFNDFAKAAKSALTFDTATPELLANAPDEVKKAWEKAYNEIQKYRDKEREEVADIVVQYRNTQEEIVALTAEAEEKKRKIRESKNLTPVEKQQITAQIDADLNYEIFRKSGEYLKFFNAILSMTGKEAEDVGRKIKEALDEKLKAGRISAKDYCDEMEKIDKQLEKIRQKQKGFGGLGSFAKGGLQQMFKDRFEQAQSDYNAATQNFDTAKQQFDLFSKEGNEAGMQQAQSAMDAASAMKEGASAAMQGAQGAMSTVAMIDTIVHSINDTVQGIKGSFDLIADMADSFGVDTSADTGWGAAGAFLDAFSQASQHATDAWDSLKSGNVGGVIQGVVGSVTSWFTTFNRWHDAKLQKQIERSQEIVQNIQYAYDAIERRMSSYLGNARTMRVDRAEEDIRRLEMLNKLASRNSNSFRARITQKERDKLTQREAAYKEGGAYGYQRQLMTEQLAELEKQRQAELDKKKTDSSVVADYENQIDEMKVQIQQFAEETANALYGIYLNGWAEQLGDSLVEAFAAGEDAAEAFDKTVGDIMRDVTSKMISQDILAPMFGDLRNFLFGENGMGGAFGADFKLDASEMAAMKTYLDKIKDEGIPAAEELFNAINEATGGILNETDTAKSGLSAGIQSVTEDTADLIASYINAIRADVSIATNIHWPKLLNEFMPQLSVIAQQQLSIQGQIAENTLRNAVAAEAIVKSNDDISRLLTRVTQGGAKFYVQ